MSPLYDDTKATLAVVLISVSIVVLAAFGKTFGIFRTKTTYALVGAHEKQSFVLIDKIVIAKYTRRFRFALKFPEQVLGLPIGKHVTLSAMIPNPLTGEDAKYVARQYTPVTTDYAEKGYFDLLVKIYPKNEHARFPEGGWMSQHLDSLPIGSSVDVKGPGGRIEYLENGNFQVGKRRYRVKSVGMIAGGSGITPMYQLIRHVLSTRRGTDSTNLSLLFGSQHPGDILLRSELDSLAADCPAQFRLAMTVDRVEKEEKWNGYLGFVNEDMIKATMPPPGKETLILLCGPPPMIKLAEGFLLNLGYDKELMQVF